MAGAEGIEPSAYGFGGLHVRDRKLLTTGHTTRIIFASRCFKMFGDQIASAGCL